MKNGLITGAIIVAGLSGGVLLGNYDSNSNTKNIQARNDDPEVERSYAEYGDRDCGDFSSQREAQDFFEDQGGPDDYHNLDRDGDGVACESN